MARRPLPAHRPARRGRSLPWRTSCSAARKSARICGYGPARYLTPAEVGAVADALIPITSETLRARFDPEAFREAEIYTFAENEEIDATDPTYYLVEFERIKAYFRAAAAKRNGMLLVID